ncbi:MAG: hypothetical protein HFF50_06510 [Lawsonibacter sp.]|nr:hypothetical protein [Lawsonibacter sp.]
MAKQETRSVIPIYLIGVVWLIFGVFFSLHRVSDYLICGGVSLAVFLASGALCALLGRSTPQPPPKPEVKPAPAPQNPEVEALVQERNRAVDEMRRLNDAIADPGISAQIDHLEGVAAKILDHVAANPKKLPQIRRFLDYYLPTTLKLLRTYRQMDAAGIEGANITATKGKISMMLHTVENAFDRQLDALYAEEALDISTDITVMENLLTQEGLKDSGDFRLEL